jgi:hypothetical protein
MAYARLMSVALGVSLAMGAAEGRVQAAPETPTQFYMRYRVAFEQAKSWDDIAAFMSSRSRTEFEAKPPALRPKMFALVKVLGAVKNPKVVKEEKSADGGVTVTAEGIEPLNGKKSTGTIKLVNENGAWKIDSESWAS